MWRLLGITIGVVAGLGAVVSYFALTYTGEFLLGYLAGYRIATPVGEGPAGWPRTAGALLSALIVARFASEATGHGTPPGHRGGA